MNLKYYVFDPNFHAVMQVYSLHAYLRMFALLYTILPALNDLQYLNVDHMQFSLYDSAKYALKNAGIKHMHSTR